MLKSLTSFFLWGFEIKRIHIADSEAGSSGDPIIQIVFFGGA
jgi:hypothetical protein